MGAQAEELKRRTRRFALDVCRLLKILPYEEPGPTVKKQLAKSSTGMAANYRSTCRARSHAEFTSRIGVVVDESDESLFWLEFVRDADLDPSDAVVRLIQEAEELTAIFSASLGTARARSRDLGATPPRRAIRQSTPEQP